VVATKKAPEVTEAFELTEEDRGSGGQDGMGQAPRKDGPKYMAYSCPRLPRMPLQERARRSFNRDALDRPGLTRPLPEAMRREITAPPARALPRGRGYGGGGGRGHRQTKQPAQLKPVTSGLRSREAQPGREGQAGAGGCLEGGN
jgi:hypothetical protein